MLGNSVSDPLMAEAPEPTEISGLGLLDTETVFSGEKVQTQTNGVFSDIPGMLSVLNGMEYEGYEIHLGRSTHTLPVMGNNNVYGSYIHGIFDASGISNTILKAICAHKSIDFEKLNSFDKAEYKSRQYDLLADVVREGLDMEHIYRILNREV